MARCAILGLVLVSSVPLVSAQDEDALRKALEGREVVVKIDLPASHKGVDLRFDRPQPLDEREEADRLRDFDVAVRAGERVPVSRVHVKDDLIEFQLAGGGFNWGTQSTTQTFNATPKSSRESELDRDIKKETDRDRKRDMERERDDLRREREREDDRRRRDVEDYNRRAHQRDLDRALASGSRINLRFKKHVPADALTADGLRRYLEPWVDFNPAGDAPRPVRDRDREVGPAYRDDRPRTAGPSWLRKGMSRADVEERLGRPRRQRACEGDQLDCRTALYVDGNTDVEVTFVEDVVVRVEAHGER